MRYLVGLVFGLALAASPLGVRAQEGGDAAEPQPVGTQAAEEAQPAQSWLERMHPGAFEAPAKTPESGFEIEYAPAESQPYTEEGRGKGISRGGKIALGILVPAFVVGVAVGTWVGVSLSKDPLFGGL